MRRRPNAAVIRAQTLSSLLLVAAVLAALTACGDRPAVFETPLNISGPIVVGRHLAYLDHTREGVTLVRPATGDVLGVTLGRRPSFMLPSPDRESLLVLCRGWLATSADEIDEAPSLHVIDPFTGDDEVFLLGSPYDEVALSDDNRYAVAFFSASRDLSDVEVFRNPNAVAILDLETGDLREKSVRSFGDIPRGVIFSPSTMAPIGADGETGAPRTLAVVFAEGYVTILDVEHPERREVTVRLTLPGSSTEIVPERMVFAPEAGTAYLRAAGSNDVYMLTLTSREAAGPTENDFVVSINTLAAGSVPADVALFRDGERQMVLVANQGSGDLTVIDVHTAEFFTIPVGDPVDRLLLHPADDPEVAVVFSQGTQNQRLHFLELRDLWDQRGRNLTPLSSADNIVGIDLVPNRPLALVTHEGANSVMSVLDLEEQTLSPFTGQGYLRDYAMTGDGRILAGIDFEGARLGVVDLDILSSRTVVLEHTPVTVLTLEAGLDDPSDPELQTVVVDHQEPFGQITVVPEPLSGRQGAFVLSGFLLEGVFEQ